MCGTKKNWSRRPKFRTAWIFRVSRGTVLKPNTYRHISDAKRSSTQVIFQLRALSGTHYFTLARWGTMYIYSLVDCSMHLAAPFHIKGIAHVDLYISFREVKPHALYFQLTLIVKTLLKRGTTKQTSISNLTLWVVQEPHNSRTYLLYSYSNGPESSDEQSTGHLTVLHAATKYDMKNTCVTYSMFQQYKPQTATILWILSTK